jgi:pyridoxal 5-phosphate dependent beta-lyase
MSIRDVDEIQLGAAAAILAARWRAARAPITLAHLDTAACGRMSAATIAATAAHLAAESERGGYMAEIDAGPALDEARDSIARALSPSALTGADVSFQHSATSAFAAVVAAWPLPSGALVGVVPGEFGSNAMALATRAAQAGATLVDLPTDALGRIDLDALDRDGVAHADGLRLGLDALAFVTFPHVASHSGVVQPAREVAERTAAAGTDLILDVAQSLGHVPCAGIAASAWIGTSRKWLCGPRGVGFAAVRAGLTDRLGLGLPNLHTAVWSGGALGALGAPAPRSGSGPSRPDRPGPRRWTELAPAPGIARLGIGESSAAARVGLASAMREATALAGGLPSGCRFEAIDAIGRTARTRLDGVAGWRRVEPLDTPGAIVTLRPPAGVDPTETARRLYRDHGVLVTPIEIVRAPRAIDRPLLRASPHLYSTVEEIERLADALEREAARK